MRTRSAAWVVQQAGGDRGALASGLYADLMVALAGEVAQKLAGYPELEFGSDKDIDNAINFALHLARIEAGLSIEFGPDELRQELQPGDPLRAAGEAIIERAQAETVTMLKDDWQAVVRVAGSLVKRDQLTLAELDHIIAHGRLRH